MNQVIVTWIRKWYNKYMHPKSLKEKVIRLRKLGKTYGEIIKEISIPLPKSTLSNWCDGILLSQMEKEKIRISQITRVKRGMETAWVVNKARREKYLASIDARILPLQKRMKDVEVKKIALAMLYLGEGKKKTTSYLSLGNSDPKIIRLFLSFLRSAYAIEENKFRCTVQCRADQDTKSLEKFWAILTGIPIEKFYKARIDSRTIGKPSRKLDYKGVCVINYFSADIFWELMKIGELIANGPIA